MLSFKLFNTVTSLDKIFLTFELCKTSLINSLSLFTTPEFPSIGFKFNGGTTFDAPEISKSVKIPHSSITLESKHFTL